MGSCYAGVIRSNVMLWCLRSTSAFQNRSCTLPVHFSGTPQGFYPTMQLHTQTHSYMAQAGLMQGKGGLYPHSQTVLSTLLNIKAQIDVPCGGRLKDTRGGEKDTWEENHTTETSLHKKGPILISSEEQGIVSSNLVITSGWRTPSFPTLWPLAKISAHRPGKKAGPEKDKVKEKSMFLLAKCQQTFNTKSPLVYFKNNYSLNHWLWKENASSYFLVFKRRICYQETLARKKSGANMKIRPL